MLCKLHSLCNIADANKRKVTCLPPANCRYTPSVLECNSSSTMNRFFSFRLFTATCRLHHLSAVRSLPNLQLQSLRGVSSIRQTRNYTQYVQKRFRFASTATGLTDSERLLLDSIKRRAPKKKSSIHHEVEGLSERPVTALSTAEEYNIDAIQRAIEQQGLYQPVLHEDNYFDDEVLHLTAKYKTDEKKREFFIFSEGSIVFWNMSSNEVELVLKFLKDYEINSYEQEIVIQEREEIDVVYTSDVSTRTKFNKGLIYLNQDNEPGIVHLEKYAFSNAIALSVKLSIWEANLDRYIDSIAYVTQDMKEGRKIKLTREQVFQKTGQLFGLRHRLNLSSDLLDTPDFYWDREELERLFAATHAHLNINKRTRVMNEKLNSCIELMELLSGHLNDIHHVRLEWMIIVLIMIEVFFEIMHYVERLVSMSSEEAIHSTH